MPSGVKCSGQRKSEIIAAAIVNIQIAMLTLRITFKD